jgi:hypothetical protein
VYFSAEARMYSMVTFLVLLSLNYLVDFEQKKDTKSLIKLVIANVLIPYTLVGGILYNISLLACYSIYLYKNKKEDLCKYLTGVLSEIVLLIPYFALIIHYAIMRNSFVIKHEGQLAFFNIVDVVRNFFGTNIISNVYWTSDAPYNLTLAFSLLVILPCVYFLYGIVQGIKHRENCFVKTLYSVFILNFVLMVLVASCQISVFTGRYILYILPPLFILAVVGLAAKLSQKHLMTFVVFFVVCSTYFDITNFTVAKDLKTLAFKSIYLESQELELNADDLIIMPFGSDAPYYFRTSDTPRVLNFDFHKEARNPYNEKFYDKNQMPLMSKDVKYSLIYDIVHSNNGFSENHFKYFINNVNATVPSGRYVMIALYGDDANALVPLDVLKNSVQSLKDVKSDILSIMLKKYLVDVVAYLEFDFKFVKRYTKGNYTYLIFQKK